MPSIDWEAERFKEDEMFALFSSLHSHAKSYLQTSRSHAVSLSNKWEILNPHVVEPEGFPSKIAEPLGHS